MLLKNNSPNNLDRKKTAYNRGFVKLGHKCQILRIVILINICGMLNICALKAPTSQSPKTFAVTKKYKLLASCEPITNEPITNEPITNYSVVKLGMLLYICPG